MRSDDPAPAAPPVAASLLLFAYDHEAFIEAALRAALAQDYEPMEVVVTDDRSTDGTVAVIERVLAGYAGAKRVRFLRNEANVGLAESINRAAAAARGDVLVLAAGDDVSFPGRTAAVMEAFAAGPHVKAVYSNARVMNASGGVGAIYYARDPRPVTLAKFMEADAAIHGATAAYRRELFTLFGPLAPRLASEDRVLSLRAAILGEVAYLRDPLVAYRRHSANAWYGARERALEDRARWLDHMTREREGLVGIFENRLRDLEAGGRLAPARRAELGRVRRATETFLRRTRIELDLLARPTFANRLAATVKLASTGAGGLELRRWVGRHFFPERSFRRQRRARG